MFPQHYDDTDISFYQLRTENISWFAEMDFIFWRNFLNLQRFFALSSISI